MRRYPPSSSGYTEVLVLHALQPPSVAVVATPPLLVMPSPRASSYVVWHELPAPNSTATKPALNSSFACEMKYGATLSWWGPQVLFIVRKYWFPIGTCHTTCGLFVRTYSSATQDSYRVKFGNLMLAASHQWV